MKIQDEKFLWRTSLSTCLRSQLGRTREEDPKLKASLGASKDTKTPEVQYEPYKISVKANLRSLKT